MVAEIRELYGVAQGLVGVPLEESELAPPSGVYLVGWDGDIAAAGGGVRTISDGVGEIKRMYVVPSHRGKGFGAELLAALERASLDLGHKLVRLDTGSLQPAALKLYASKGYKPIDNYNGNRLATYFGEKVLRAD